MTFSQLLVDSSSPASAASSGIVVSVIRSVWQLLTIEALIHVTSWSPFYLGVAVFTYVGFTGLFFLFRLLKSQSIQSATTVLLWSNFLLSCYFICFSWEWLLGMLQIRSLELLDWLEESAIYPVQGSWLVFLVNSFKSSVVRLLFDQSHSTTASSVILATTAVDTAATNLAAVTDYYGRNATLPIKQYFGPFIISNSVSSSWYGPFINTSFSHTLCLIIGIFICFGLVCFYESLEKKMKNPWPPGSKEVLDIAADITFHFKFAIGCFLWFKFFFSIVFGDAASPVISAMEAFNLATSHTLAFSIGMFCFKDYMYQLERQDKGEEESNTATVTVFNRYQPRVDSKIMMTYCASSFILVIGRIAWQLLSSIYNWNPPQDIQVVAVTSLVLFLCLPSRGLVSYFIPPLITFFMCICSIIWESYMPMHLLQLKYETIVLILTSAIGGASVTACYFISRKVYSGGSKKEDQYRDRRASSRRHRARKYPTPYPKGWYRVFSSKDIKRGDVKHIHCLGHQFAVFRGNDSGLISITDAFCPHLGANMALGGKVIGDRIQCPFHGWEFEGKDGKCSRIPYRDDVPSVAKVRVWPVHEYMGIIFIYFDSTGEAPTYYPESFPNIDNGSMICLGEKSEQVQLHLQDVAENAADWMHFSIVHGKISSIPLLGNFTVIKHITDFTFFDDRKYYMEFSDIPKVYSIFNDETPMLPDSVTSTVGICGPASIMYFKFHTPYGLVMLAKTFLPHRAMEVTMHDYSWCDKTVPKLLARYIVREASLAFNDDILIWNLKAYPAKPILLKEDIAIKRVRQWYSQFYSAAEKKRGGWEEVGGGVFVAPAAEPDLLQQKQQVEINSKPSSSASTTSSTFSTTPLSPMTTTSIPLGCSSSSSSSKNSTNIESLPGCPGSIDVDW